MGEKKLGEEARRELVNMNFENDKSPENIESSRHSRRLANGKKRHSNENLTSMQDTNHDAPNKTSQKNLKSKSKDVSQSKKRNSNKSSRKRSPLSLEGMILRINDADEDLISAVTMPSDLRCPITQSDDKKNVNRNDTDSPKDDDDKCALHRKSATAKAILAIGNTADYPTVAEGSESKVVQGSESKVEEGLESKVAEGSESKVVEGSESIVKAILAIGNNADYPKIVVDGEAGSSFATAKIKSSKVKRVQRRSASLGEQLSDHKKNHRRISRSRSTECPKREKDEDSKTGPCKDVNTQKIGTGSDHQNVDKKKVKRFSTSDIDDKKDTDPPELVSAHSEGLPRRPSSIRPGCTGRLKRLVAEDNTMIEADRGVHIRTRRLISNLCVEF